MMHDFDEKKRSFLLRFLNFGKSKKVISRFPFILFEEVKKGFGGWIS